MKKMKLGPEIKLFDIVSGEDEMWTQKFHSRVSALATTLYYLFIKLNSLNAYYVPGIVLNLNA